MLCDKLLPDFRGGTLQDAPMFLQQKQSCKTCQPDFTRLGQSGLDRIYQRHNTCGRASVDAYSVPLLKVRLPASTATSFLVVIHLSLA